MEEREVIEEAMRKTDERDMEEFDIPDISERTTAMLCRRQIDDVAAGWPHMKSGSHWQNVPITGGHG